MISAIIPHWPRKREFNGMARDVARNLDAADEVIVVVNEGTGMGKAINMGFEIANGDYLVVCSNDCYLTQGSLEDLCDPECITVPKDVPGQYNQPRSFYCMPRWIYEKVGGYDEQFVPAYFEDDDIINRWREAGIKLKVVEGVVIRHDPGTTMDSLPNRDEVFERNQKLYREKWGNDAKNGPENNLEVV